MDNFYSLNTNDDVAHTEKWAVQSRNKTRSYFSFQVCSFCLASRQLWTKPLQSTTPLLNVSRNSYQTSLPLCATIYTTSVMQCTSLEVGLLFANFGLVHAVGSYALLLGWDHLEMPLYNPVSEHVITEALKRVTRVVQIIVSLYISCTQRHQLI